MEKRLQLYIHIPFCISKCRYCTACVVTGDSAAKATYLEALGRELDAAIPLLQEYSIASVYLGGGSPTCMNPDAVAKLMRNFLKRIPLEKGAEVTIEAMPQTIGTPSLTGLSTGGFNRYSLSMQSSSNDELKALDCGFDITQVQHAVLFLDTFHKNNVNIDLMYGNPGQTLRSWKSTLHAARDLGPTHISLYRFSGDAAGCPDAETVDSFYEFAQQFLAELRYEQYTVNHFAKQNRKSKYFINRCNGMEYLGFGLGARSFIDGMIYENTTDWDTYLAHAANFEQLVTNVIQLSDAQLEEYYAVKARCGDGSPKRQ